MAQKTDRNPVRAEQLYCAPVDKGEQHNVPLFFSDLRIRRSVTVYKVYARLIHIFCNADRFASNALGQLTRVQASIFAYQGTGTESP